METVLNKYKLRIQFQQVYDMPKQVLQVEVKPYKLETIIV